MLYQIRWLYSLYNITSDDQSQEWTAISGRWYQRHRQQHNMELLTLTLTTFTLMQVTASQTCNFGASCRFPCNCQQSGDMCDVDTGSCPGGCKVGSSSEYDWSGHGCLTGNVAYGKYAEQNGISGGLTAAGAVDGSTDTRHGCSLPLAEIPPSGQCPSNDQCQNAWWQVDLGRLHRITRVIIVNTARAGETIRMNQIFIKVSNGTHVIDGASQCAIVDDTMDSGETRSFKCRTPLIGQYVTLFKYSNTTDGRDLIGSFTVCEVMVIGNMYNDCGQCSNPDVCTDQYGCVSGCTGFESDTLCNTECPDGNFGINCQSVCGQCFGTYRCDKQSGRCPNGCQLWWADDMCLTQIAEVNFADSSRLSLTAKGSSQFSISWPAISSIRRDISQYYRYAIEYKRSSASRWTNVKSVAHSHNMVYEETIRYLTYNTQYTARVTPYRTHRGQHDDGNSIKASVKTPCDQPDPPEITNIADISPAGDRGLERIYVSWRLPDNSRSGCDNIDTGSCSISYKLRNTVSWSRVNCGYPSTSTTIRVYTAGTYDVIVSISNNEGVSSSSPVRTVTIENIVPAEFLSSDRLSVGTFSSVQIEVSWSAISSILREDAAKFGYQLEYKLTSDTQQTDPWITVAREPHVPGQSYVLTVPGLTYNSRYTIRVRPYMIYQSNRIYGTGISVVQKTACIEPDPPRLTNVTVIDPDGVTGLERVYVSWTTSESGCNSLRTCVHYIIDSTQSEQQCLTTTVTAGTEVIVPPRAGNYDLYIKATNDENLFSTSDTRSVTIRDIQAGGFPSLDDLSVTRTTWDTMTVSWRAMVGVPDVPGLYGYQLQYRANTPGAPLSDTWVLYKNMSHIPGHVYTETIAGLATNTRYIIRVTPYKINGSALIYGKSIGTEQTILCDIAEPHISHVAAVSPSEGTSLERISISWTLPPKNGCTNYTQCMITYKTETTELKTGCPSTPGPRTDVLSVHVEGDYDIRVGILNEGTLSRNSEIKRVTIGRKSIAGSAASGGRANWLPVYVAVPVCVVFLALTIVANVLIARRNYSNKTSSSAEYVNVDVKDRRPQQISERTESRSGHVSGTAQGSHSGGHYVNVGVSNPVFDQGQIISEPDGQESGGVTNIVEPGQTDDNPYEDIRNETRDLDPSVYDVITTE